MKKLIVTIICVLFASTSFAQMVGASSISKQSTPKTTLGVKKHEFSIHGGVGSRGGEGIWDEEIALSGILKYKHKPSEKYDIRFLAETGILGLDDNSGALPVIPFLVGVNYERRLNNNWSLFADLGAGISIPLTQALEFQYTNNHFYQDWYYDFAVGIAFSPEIGFSYKNFMFSFKSLFSLNECSYDWFNEYSSSYDSHYFLFTLGYRF